MHYGQFFDLNKIHEAGLSSCYMVPPMLINKIPSGKESRFSEICNSGEYMGSIKVDGAAYIYEKTADGKSYLFGRTVSKKNGLLTHKEENVPHIIEAFDKFLPPQTIIVTEIFYPHKESKDVVTIMGCLPEKAIARQKDNPIHCYCHDLLMYNGKDYINEPAIKRWEQLIRVCTSLLIYPYFHIADGRQKNLEAYIHNALERGEEGVVLRKKTSPYFPGKRPAWVTLKFKQHDSVDVVCMGFEEPSKRYTGKELDTWSYWLDGVPVTKPYYYGWKSAMQVGCYNSEGSLVKIGTVSSGLGESLQELFGTPEGEKYIGQVVQLDCMSINKKDHTLRHPYFVDFRPDKNAQECTFEEVFK